MVFKPIITEGWWDAHIKKSRQNAVFKEIFGGGVLNAPHLHNVIIKECVSSKL
jgi:hypothetical protein